MAEVKIAGRCVRTPEEIQQQRAKVGGGFFNFQGSDLLEWLPFAIAKDDLKEGVTEAEWAEAQKSGDPLDSVRDYLPFAWGKANDQRGLSADRSVQHLRAWLWLAGYDVNADFDERYELYGKPCLVVASEITGFDWRSHDDGVWSNTEGGRGLSNPDRDQRIAEAIDFARQLNPA